MAARLNIVVVEDHDDLREVMVEFLSEQGHRVLGLSCAEDLDDSVGSAPIDLLIVDLNLPDEDGLSLTRRFRAAQAHAGVIIVTARNQVADKINGYAHGADIYLQKPVAPDELIAAVGALSRRLKHVPPPSEEDMGSNFCLESRTMRLHGPQGSVVLTDAETAILMAMARAPSQRLESWQILELLGITADTNSKANLEVRIVRLRKKLMGLGAEKTCIRVIRALGYQLLIPLTVL